MCISPNLYSTLQHLPSTLDLISIHPVWSRTTVSHVHDSADICHTLQQRPSVPLHLHRKAELLSTWSVATHVAKLSSHGRPTGAGLYTLFRLLESAGCNIVLEIAILELHPSPESYVSTGRWIGEDNWEFFPPASKRQLQSRNNADEWLHALQIATEILCWLGAWVMWTLNSSLVDLSFGAFATFKYRDEHSSGL